MWARLMCLFVHVFGEDMYIPMYRFVYVLCAVSSMYVMLNMFYVPAVVCVMCSVQSQTSSRRPEHASLPSVGYGPPKDQEKGPTKAWRAQKKTMGRAQ